MHMELVVLLLQVVALGLEIWLHLQRYLGS
jgi:hypothetical protein